MDSAAELFRTSVTVVLTLDELAVTPERVRDLSPLEAAELLLRVVGLQTALLSRVLPAAPNEHATGATVEDRLLTPQEAARRLGVSPRWLYRHAKRLPFTRHLSRKALRFSAEGLEKYLRQRQGR